MKHRYPILSIYFLMGLLFAFTLKAAHDYAHHNEWCQNTEGHWYRGDCNDDTR